MLFTVVEHSLGRVKILTKQTTIVCKLMKNLDVKKSEKNEMHAAFGNEIE